MIRKLKSISKFNWQKIGILMLLTMQNIIILRDVMLDDETNWISFSMTTIGSIALLLLVGGWIIDRKE